MMNSTDQKGIINPIKQHLAEYLGVEIEDIDDDDSLTQDLHMRPSDLTDFLETLKTNNIDTNTVDLTEIETVGELIDAVNND